MQSGKGEQALLEEQLWAIAHLINIAEHLVEYTAVKQDEEAVKLTTTIREIRKETVNKVFNILFSGSKELRGYADNLWCTLKHMLSAMIHSEEVAEKLAEEGEKTEAIWWARLSRTMLVLAIQLINRIKQIQETGANNDKTS